MPPRNAVLAHPRRRLALILLTAFILKGVSTAATNGVTSIPFFVWVAARLVDAGVRLTTIVWTVIGYVMLWPTLSIHASSLFSYAAVCFVIDRYMRRQEAREDREQALLERMWHLPIDWSDDDDTIIDEEEDLI
ncbi:hypothetical protein RRF57_007797 [Xylaria bambusicola]|uniref:Uncharacterized protein n=1 Tax=Xylaria bambusicola TaxID=326684 RepID=A0AAN7ULP6_9PEZI